MKFLVLTHDLDQAINWLKRQPVDNLYMIDEREIAKHNPTKFSEGFLNISYSDQMVDFMRVNVLAYKSQRPLAIVMDMRHQNAVAKITHNVSILFYDDSRKLRLSYHPKYTVDCVIPTEDTVIDAKFLG